MVAGGRKEEGAENPHPAKLAADHGRMEAVRQDGEAEW